MADLCSAVIVANMWESSTAPPQHKKNYIPPEIFLGVATDNDKLPG